MKGEGESGRGAGDYTAEVIAGLKGGARDHGGGRDASTASEM